MADDLFTGPYGNLPRTERFWMAFEVKETYDGGTLSRPDKYPNDIHHLLGIAYATPKPKVVTLNGIRYIPFIDDDDAYALALAARFEVWTAGRWQLIGKAEDFLHWFQQATSMREQGYEDWKISWPQVWSTAPRFREPEAHKVLPYRELLRRHVENLPYITDHDILVDLLYRRRRLAIPIAGFANRGKQ